MMNMSVSGNGHDKAFVFITCGACSLQFATLDNGTPDGMSQLPCPFCGNPLQTDGCRDRKPQVNGTGGLAA